MKYDQFFTPVRINEINVIDSFSHQFGFIGSCFSDHMFQRFRHHGLEAWLSPFGTTYNPISIANQLLGLIDLSSDFNHYDNSGQSFYWETSHKITSHNPASLKSTVDSMRLETQKALQQTDTLFITLGSAWAYELNSNGLIVANCHKLPASNFSKRLLEISEITDALHQVITRINRLNPLLKIVLTVSPVRHLRDGLVENSRSKARLIEACHSVVDHALGCVYFPSYEVLVDELRDYRFFEKDGAHPTDFAIDLVFEKVKNALFTDTFQKVLTDVARIRQMELHQFTAQSNPIEIQKHQQLIELSKMKLNADHKIRW